jgi:hypothetical protein
MHRHRHQPHTLRRPDLRLPRQPQIPLLRHPLRQSRRIP